MAAPNPYPGLRQMVLSRDPVSLQNELEVPGEVRGLLLDMAAPNGIATLVALADGTVSLYLSNGGGVLGLGKHPVSKQLVREILTSAPQYLSFAESVPTAELPQPMYTRFHFLTLNGTKVYEAREEDLGYNRDPLSPFFHHIHKLMNVARIAMQAQASRKQQG